MGMQASPVYRMRYTGTLEAQSTGEDTILRKQGLSYLHYTAERGLFLKKRKRACYTERCSVDRLFLIVFVIASGLRDYLSAVCMSRGARLYMAALLVHCALELDMRPL